MVGPGTANRLAALGIKDLYGVVHCDGRILYKIFGVDVECLIDYAWRKEQTEINDIRTYKPSPNSIPNSQVLSEDYNYKDAYLIMKEMVEANVLQLTGRHLASSHISLFIGYSKNTIKSARGSRKITDTTNSYRTLLEESKLLYKKIVNPNYPIR